MTELLVLLLQRDATDIIEALNAHALIQ